MTQARRLDQGSLSHQNDDICHEAGAPRTAQSASLIVRRFLGRRGRQPRFQLRNAIV